MLLQYRKLRTPSTLRLHVVAPPDRPHQPHTHTHTQELPFPPTQENAPKMRKWLMDWYAASTFNTCPHQPLLDMTGPPLAIRVEASVQPAVTNHPVRVPVHWREEVHQQIECDKALGVIEKVPPNTPVTWLHNMVVTPKSDGSGAGVNSGIGIGIDANSNSRNWNCKGIE